MIAMNDIEFRLLKQYLLDVCGIEIPTEKRYLFRTRLAGFLEELGCTSFSQFYARLSRDGNSELSGRLIEAMTTNETGFFRDGHPFAAMRHRVLDDIAQRRRGVAGVARPRIRALSAGCATGEEPYSVAMTLTEWLASQHYFTVNDVSVFAVDISQRVLQQARRGVYSVAQLGRNIPPGYLSKYYDVTGGKASVKQPIRNMVVFAEQNLAEPCSMLGIFDLIMCRNVMIYFSAELKALLVARFYEMLQPGGALFLGASESMYPLSEKFRAVHAFESTYYVKD